MLLLILAACGTAPDPSTEPPAMPTEMASPSPGMAMPLSESKPFDQMFIDMMVPHHQGAVEMATIARTRAEHAEIKAMAEGIITSQEAEIGRMKGWRKTWFGSEDTPAAAMPMAHADMPGMAEMPGTSSMSHMAKDIEALKTATPFDLAFLDAMIPHHEGAVTMAQACASKSQHDEVKALAGDIIRDQEKEIAQMRECAMGIMDDADTSIDAMNHDMSTHMAGHAQHTSLTECQTEESDHEAVIDVILDEMASYFDDWRGQRMSCPES
jgi:uncharacterized protein (DUF305 family)